MDRLLADDPWGEDVVTEPVCTRCGQPLMCWPPYLCYRCQLQDELESHPVFAYFMASAVEQAYSYPEGELVRRVNALQVRLAIQELDDVAFQYMEGGP